MTDVRFLPGCEGGLCRLREELLPYLYEEWVEVRVLRNKLVKVSFHKGSYVAPSVHDGQASYYSYVHELRCLGSEWDGWTRAKRSS